MQLLTLRTKAGLSQEFVARQLGVSRNTVKNWEDGKSIPTADKAVRLAKMFGTTVEVLMGVSKPVPLEDCQNHGSDHDRL